MENRFSSGKLTFLGNPTPWMKQFLGGLQQIGPFDVEFENNLSKYMAHPWPKNRVGIVILELTTQGRDLMEALRKSGRSYLFIWVGKEFTKEDLQYAFEMRVHTVLEKPLPDDEKVLAQVRRAVASAESSERTEDLAFAVKSVLLQLEDAPDDDAALAELKTGLLKLQKHAVANEFLGSQQMVSTATPAMQKLQNLSDALLSVEDLERTGTMVVKARNTGVEGRIDFLQGRPIHAVCGEARSLKAIYRMFLWDDAQYSFIRRAAREMVVEERFNFSMREICLEGQSLFARYEKIRTQLPPAQLQLVLEPSALHTGTRLDPDHFSTLSSVVELRKVSQILDYNTLPDVVLLESLIALKKSGVIRVAT